MTKENILKSVTLEDLTTKYIDSFYTFFIKGPYRQKLVWKLREFRKDPIYTKSLYQVEKEHPYFLLECVGKSIPVFLLYKKLVDQYVEHIVFMDKQSKLIKKLGYEGYRKHLEKQGNYTKHYNQKTDSSIPDINIDSNRHKI